MVIKACLFTDYCTVDKAFFGKRVHCWILADVLNDLLSSGYKIFTLLLRPFFTNLFNCLEKCLVCLKRPFNVKRHCLRKRALISAITSSCGRVSPRLDCSSPRWMDALVESFRLSQKSFSESPSNNLTSSSKASSSVAIIFSTILNFVEASIKIRLSKFNLNSWQTQQHDAAVFAEIF